MRPLNRTIGLLCPFVLAWVAASAFAQEEGEIIGGELEIVEANTLDELLKNVQDRRVVENAENVRREQEFRAQRDRQAEMLDEARAEKRRLERRGDQLQAQFDENEIRIGTLQDQYNERLGKLRELFGVLQQVAGDTRSRFDESLISAQYPNRGEWLGDFAQRMGQATQLATIDEMEELWEALLHEAVESGKVTRFTAPVDRLDGSREDTEVLRVGSFGIIDETGYVNYDWDLDRLVELGRQPEAQFKNTADALFEADPGDLVSFAIDPTRGSLTRLLIQKATFGEMVGTPFGGIADGHCYLPFCDGQGDYPGSIIILVGIIGVLLAIERLITLTLVGRKVNQQRNQPEAPSEDNPLGRVIKVYDDNRDVDTETLELKLGEGILAEMPALTRNIAIIQVISIVAPLMGLLGTVIGMIETFQSITLFGAGDPKTMASGISTALMTTVLGLCVAIATTLLHAIVNQRSRSIIHILDEQSAGIVAQHAEESGEPVTETE